MNAFANWLFTLLLGWTGGLFNRGWNALVNAAGGISDFFTRYWLLLVVGLILFGTVMDYAVWLVRWRPYLVWRSWLRRTLSRREQHRANEDLHQTEMDENTLHTIADWVATPQEQYPVYELESQQQAAPGYAMPSAPEPEQPFQPEAGYADPAQPGWAYEEPAPYFSEAPAEPVYDPARFQPAPRLFQHGESPGEPTGFEEWAWQEQESPAPAEQPPPGPVRRRRSERGKGRTLVHRLADLKDRFTSDDQEEGMLDGLPAPVRQQDAFHEAVYPRSYQRPQPPIEAWPDDQPADNNQEQP